MLLIDQLVKRHGTRTVLDHVGFEARPGRVTVFLGANGAGKSSTLRILLGLDRPDGGSALVGGRPYRSLRDPLRTVGSMLDGSGAHRARTARDHLAWLARSNGIDRRRVGEVLDQVGLAAALLGEPRALVLDEPVNGLDPEGSRWMRALLRDQAAAGGTVLLSTHLMAEVADVADDLVVIAGGRIVATGTLAEFTAGYDRLEDAFFALTGGDGRAHR
ncbi:ABC transporter ATP-binding protein [Occultella kanbiaonis]|uniref:ABC transporter ATP-binding protein n=1 Tax=Occultella kanbiaonis TaxID=2675754 RepID=UPI0013D737C9|nr:ATP-binding cassette domain-containing protein [Occultella kanbiaonis]